MPSLFSLTISILEAIPKLPIKELETQLSAIRLLRERHGEGRPNNSLSLTWQMTLCSEVCSAINREIAVRRAKRAGGGE